MRLGDVMKELEEMFRLREVVIEGRNVEDWGSWRVEWRLLVNLFG